LSVLKTPAHIRTSSAYEALLMRLELVCVKPEPPEMSVGTYDGANYVKLVPAGSA